MILHVDMDAFYASAEQRDRPELRERPVIVGGDPQGRGVVSAASYEARTYGVHSAMPSATARRLCPMAVFLPPRIDHYASISREIREIFERYTPLVEPLSLDEAFLDVRGSEKLFGPAAAIGRHIQRTIREELRLVASVGVAPNKFLAKIASDLDKPDGFVVVEADRVQQFSRSLAGRPTLGSGQGQQSRVREPGRADHRPVAVSAIGRVCKSRLGQSGEHLWNLAHGRDDRPVVPDHEAKSISHETTFAVDIADRAVLRAWLLGVDRSGRAAVASPSVARTHRATEDPLRRFPNYYPKPNVARGHRLDRRVVASGRRTARHAIAEGHATGASGRHGRLGLRHPAARYNVSCSTNRSARGTPNWTRWPTPSATASA